MLKKWMLITGCASGLFFASQLPEVWAQQGRANGRNNGTQPHRDNGKRQLGALWNGVWRIEGSMAPLSPAQAKRIIAVMRPWSSKNSMTDAQAKSLVSSINGVLTASQKSVVGDLNEGPGGGPRGRGGPPRGDGPPHNGGRGDGPPPRDGNGPPPPRDGDGPPGMDAASREMMAALNPFYAPTGYSTFKSLPARMQIQLLHRYQESRATLIALSRKAG